MKLVMAIVVIAIHTHPFENCKNAIVLDLYFAITELAVPFFFIATGYFLGRGELKGKKYVVKEQLVKITKLYLFWSVIYFPLAFMDYIQNEYSFLVDICLYIRGLFLRGEHYNSWMLWYLLSEIYTLLVIIILRQCKINKKNTLIICFTMGWICSTFFDMISNYMGSLSFFLLLKGIVKYSVANGRILRGFIYIPIGFLLSMYKNSFKKNLLMCVAGYVFIIFLPETIQNIGIIICSIGLFGLVLSIKLADKWYYPLFRTASMVMYFSHLWIWTIYYYFMYHRKQFGFDCFLASILAAMSLGIVYYGVVQRKKCK